MAPPLWRGSGPPGQTAAHDAMTQESPPSPNELIWKRFVGLSSPLQTPPTLLLTRVSVATLQSEKQTVLMCERRPMPTAQQRVPGSLGSPLSQFTLGSDWTRCRLDPGSDWTRYGLDPVQTGSWFRLDPVQAQEELTGVGPAYLSNI